MWLKRQASPAFSAPGLRMATPGGLGPEKKSVSRENGLRTWGEERKSWQDARAGQYFELRRSHLRCLFVRMNVDEYKTRVKKQTKWLLIWLIVPFLVLLIRFGHEYVSNAVGISAVVLSLALTLGAIVALLMLLVLWLKQRPGGSCCCCKIDLTIGDDRKLTVKDEETVVWCGKCWRQRIELPYEEKRLKAIGEIIETVYPQKKVVTYVAFEWQEQGNIFNTVVGKAFLSGLVGLPGPWLLAFGGEGGDQNQRSGVLILFESCEVGMILAAGTKACVSIGESVVNVGPEHDHIVVKGWRNKLPLRGTLQVSFYNSGEKIKRMP